MAAGAPELRPPNSGTGPGYPTRGRGPQPGELVPWRWGGRAAGAAGGSSLQDGAGGGPISLLLGMLELHTFPCLPGSVAPSPFHTLFAKGIIFLSSRGCVYISVHHHQCSASEKKKRKKKSLGETLPAKSVWRLFSLSLISTSSKSLVCSVCSA